MVDYIDAHSDEFGVEPICTTLQFAPSTYYAAKTRAPSPRAVRDAILMPLLLALWIANYRVYGARKLWKAAQRDGHDIGRDQVARLMRQLGIRGVNRSKKVRTTRPPLWPPSGTRIGSTGSSSPSAPTSCGSRI
jgi:putative transposase